MPGRRGLLGYCLERSIRSTKPPTMEASHHQDRASDGTVIAGYVTAILLPIVGFFVGLVLIIKNRAGHGIAAMVLSVAVVIVAWSIAFSDSESSEVAPSTVSPGVDQVIEEQQREREQADAEFNACVERLGLDIYRSEKDRDTALEKC